MIELMIVSFMAGVLTVLAPCILPLLPVVVGGSIVRNGTLTAPQRNWLRPLVIAASLGISVILFTLLLKATTVLLGVPQSVWQVLSGGIIILLGINFVAPKVWEVLAAKSGFHSVANKFLGKSIGKQGLGGDVVTGFALGPVFNSCSPTYALIVAAVLPVSFFTGLSYLTAYAIGLAGALLVIAYAGQTVIDKLGWLSNPSGWFRRVVGVIFILVGSSIILGLDKQIQTFVLERGWYDPIIRLERSIK